MPKFKIDTRKSEYTPIIVDINEKEYEVIEIGREATRELNKYDEICRTGDMEAPYRRLEWLLGLKENHPEISKLRARDVNRITDWIIRAVYGADAAEMQGMSTAEKKKKSPGVTVSKR